MPILAVDNLLIALIVLFIPLSFKFTFDRSAKFCANGVRSGTFTSFNLLAAFDISFILLESIPDKSMFSSPFRENSPSERCFMESPL